MIGGHRQCLYSISPPKNLELVFGIFALRAFKAKLVMAPTSSACASQMLDCRIVLVEIGGTHQLYFNETLS